LIETSLIIMPAKSNCSKRKKVTIITEQNLEVQALELSTTIGHIDKPCKSPYPYTNMEAMKDHKESSVFRTGASSLGGLEDAQGRDEFG
jgi:hypothetical protein